MSSIAPAPQLVPSAPVGPKVSSNFTVTGPSNPNPTLPTKDAKTSASGPKDTGTNGTPASGLRQRKKKTKTLPVDFLLRDRDVLAALADVERAKKREEELRNKPRSRRFRDTVAEWGRLCSCHGIPHLAQARSVITIIIWAILVTATWIGFAYLLVTTVQSYLDYDTSIQVELSDEEINFPSVTICNNSPYKMSMLNSTPELNALVQLYKEAVGLS
ncbi:unnamed protein product [Bursaphelenchus okinawaensis]|uniref:Uncharacterized protein n=1 Tax=Bursaphelenchus okinawaensis TaxID=465554 RepID=A0A811KCJ2_9BILA|nr:unnamed protein product [Bursaphelenchus okinawaensis]CAG9098798.1 unnamed protein product [Bursaphelenchus okinawaensis]